MSERVKSIEEIAAEIAVKVPPEEWDKMLPDASDFIDVGDCHKEIARLRAEVARLRANRWVAFSHEELLSCFHWVTGDRPGGVVECLNAEIKTELARREESL